MSADELREVVQSLFPTLTFKQTTIDKLMHENDILKRLKFAAQSERFSAEQRSLLGETLDADMQVVNNEIEQLQSARRCRRTCRAPTSTASPIPPPARHPVAAAS